MKIGDKVKFLRGSGLPFTGQTGKIVSDGDNARPFDFNVEIDVPLPEEISTQSVFGFNEDELEIVE